MSVSTRTCQHNEVAVTLLGYGVIATEVVGNVTCTCPQSLTLTTSRPEGMFSAREYACGKDICAVNSTVPKVCERVTNTSGDDATSEFPCQCPSGYECPVQTLSTEKKTTEFTCKKV